ncbi:MAG: DUF6090 family protein [Bacteroidota bacterium]
MIKFFRRIRQRLLSENKLRKYLIYAIGEIILVVIGILLALQINNWNESRILAKTEKKLLSEFKSNLQTNVQRLTQYRTLDRIAINSMYLVENHIMNRKRYHDSLSYHFHNIQVVFDPQFVKSAYNRAQANGFNTISNDTLIQKLVNLYDEKYEFMITTFESNDFFFKTIGETLYSSFYSKSEGKNSNGEEIVRLIPSDYQELLEDHKFINQLSVWRELTEWHTTLRGDAIRETNLVIELIDLELQD